MHYPARTNATSKQKPMARLTTRSLFVLLGSFVLIGGGAFVSLRQPQRLPQYVSQAGHHLELISNSLSAVRKQLWHEPVQVSINRMGIKSEQSNDGSAVTLQLNEYCNAQGRRMIALPIQIPFDEIPERPDLLADMDRYL